MRSAILILLASSLTPFKLAAQFFSEKISRQNCSIQVLAGAQNYLGDLMPDDQFQYNRLGSSANLQPCGQVGFGIQIHRFWSLDARLFATQLQGDESKQFTGSSADQVWHRQRAISFKSFYTDLSLSATLEPLYLFRPLTIYSTPYLVSPFIRAGVGVGFAHVTRGSLLNAQQYAMASNTGEYLQRDINKGTNVWMPVFPVGLGFKARLSPTVNLLGEGLYRITLTDYLDGTGNWNPSNNNDGVVSYSLGISWNLANPSYYTPYSMSR